MSSDFKTNRKAYLAKKVSYKVTYHGLRERSTRRSIKLYATKLRRLN